MADIDDFDDEEERKRRSAASAPEFTAETIAADIWTAVYYGIPLGAGPDVLRQGYDAAMQCAGAVAGPPGFFEPMQGELGADKTREENFEHAVRRLDELNSRLRPAILDDEAERQAPAQQPAAEIAPQWQQVENDWHMIVGNETVAALVPNSDTNFPEYKWLSFIVTDDYPEHGWNNVDFETLEGAQHVLEQWWHHTRKGEAYQPEAHDKEPLTVDAIEQQPAAHIQYDREDVEDGAVEEREAAKARIAELDERLEPAISPADEMSRPLGAAELAERVRRIIENPSLADAERDDHVLQVVEERREEQSQAEAVRQDDALQVDSSQEPETQSSADRDAAEVDWLFGQQEMTEARSAAYDRWSGQELSASAGQSAGPAQEAGQSQSHSKALS